MIVMSTHGRTGLGRFIYGSVADELLRTSDLPVLLVPRDCEWSWPGDRTLRVLVPLDGSSLAEAVLGPACELADALDADLMLPHVTRPANVGPVKLLQAVQIAPAGLGEDKRVGPSLESVAAKLRAPNRAVAVREVIGSPAPAIVRVAEEETVDVIAMTTHGRGGLARVVLGSVATGVLQRTSVPLLVVCSAR